VDGTREESSCFTGVDSKIPSDRIENERVSQIPLYEFGRFGFPPLGTDRRDAYKPNLILLNVMIYERQQSDEEERTLTI